MEVAALGLKADSSQIRDATIALKDLPPAATAAERAAQRWGVATTAAGRSTEDFSRRVQGTIKQLEFERQQLTRNAAEQQRYAALRRAGVSAMSAEGQAISAAVAALQAQRAAREAESRASGAQLVVTRAAGTAWRGMLGVLAPLTAAMTAAAVAQKIWTTAMEVADFGEKADQMGVMAKTMQVLQFAGTQNGLSVEQLENGVAKFSQKIGEAADGSKEMIEALDNIGVKVLDLGGNLRPTEDLLFEVAQKIMAIDEPAKRAAAAVDFFGKAGVKMLPLLKQMAEGQDAMASAAESAGAVISDDVIAKLDKFSDRLAANGLKLRAWLASIAADIVDWGDRVEKWWDKISPNDAASVKKRQDAWRVPFENFFDWLGDSFADIIAKAVGWSAGFVAAFKELGPALKKVFADAMNGVIDAIEGGLNLAQQALSNAKGWFKTQGPVEPIRIGRLDPGAGGNFSGIGDVASAAEAAARAGMPNAAKAREQSRLIADLQGAWAQDRGDTLGADRRKPAGARNPGIKGGGSSDPYAKAIESAREYVLSKKAETEAVGQTVLAAARLKHEQDLLNKATGEGRTLSAAQKSALKDLASQMAEADNTLATAKFMDDALTKGQEYIAQQQLERDALYMTTEAALAYRLEKELINKAIADGIPLTAEQIAQLQQLAGAQAAASESTRKAKEWADFERETFNGLFADINQGLRDGKSVLEAFGDAGLNALNKISDKLIQMAADDLFNAAFGKSGGGGGLFQSIVSLVGGALGGAVGGFSGGAVGGGTGGGYGTYANGAAFRAGNVIPFASGGIVGSPTMFPMSRGRTGLMGEAGPEAIMPLRRGPGGRLGVEAANGNRQQTVIVRVTGDTDLVRVAATGAAVQVYNAREPGTVGKAVKRADKQAPAAMAQYERDRAGAEWRT